MSGNHASMTRGSYRRLGIELVIDFVVMYGVMFTMIASLDDFYPNVNNVYMTLMMVTPMAIVMLIAMRSMFPSPRISLAVGGAAVVIFVASFVAVRFQAGVGDGEFLRSMIPHHSGAILMCREAELTEPEILSLCTQIIASQQREIEQMKAILDRLGSSVPITDRGDRLGAAKEEGRRDGRLGMPGRPSPNRACGGQAVSGLSPPR